VTRGRIGVKFERLISKPLGPLVCSHRNLAANSSAALQG